MNKKKIDISIIIPCLNEEKHIKNTLTKLVKSFSNSKSTYELLVIDDGSKDATLIKINEFYQKNPLTNLKIFNHKKNKGIGYIFSKYSKLSKGEYCRMVMGDDVDYIETHKKILKYLYKYDIIIPVYKVVTNKSKLRLFISKVFTFVVNIIAFSKIGYFNGSVAFKKNNLNDIDFINDGFGFQAEIIVKLLKKRATYIEFNAKALHRQTSNSITTKNLIKVIQIILRIIKC